MMGNPGPLDLRTETVTLGAVEPPLAGDLPPGHVVAGRYEVQELLGRGGYGLVYEAIDRVTGQTVALKILRADRWNEAAVRRFGREAELVRNLRHPHLARIYQAGSAEGHLYLTMERVRGETLASRLARGPLPISEAVDLAGQVAEALAVLHEAGLVHRDVKPSNVLVDPSGRAKLADFGLTLRPGSDDARATRPNGTVGTAEYMAPEEALGEESSAAGDLYSLGVVLFEMLTGRLPHQARTSLGTLLAHVRERAPDVRKLRPEVPAWLAHVVARLLERDPAARYPSPGLLLDDLRDRRRPQRPRRRWLEAAAAVAVLLLAACALAVRELQPDDPLRDVVSGPGGLVGVGVGGEVLWRLRATEGDLVRARLKPDDPEQLVGVLAPPGVRELEVVRRLSILDPATGRTVRRVDLATGGHVFRGFSERYGVRVAATDLDGDGLDEIVVSYSHTPYWPSYVVLYEPLLERSRIVFYGSGHHRFAGAEDLDGDGVPELLLAGLNNRLGYTPVLAAVRPVPAVNRPQVGRGAIAAASPDAAYVPTSEEALLWYVLLPRRAGGHLPARLTVDRRARVLRLDPQVGAPLEVTYDGLVRGTVSVHPPGRRLAYRREGYRRLREARRLTAAGFHADSIAEIAGAVELARRAGDPTFEEHARRVQGQLLIQAGRFEQADRLFRDLATESAEIPEVAFDAGRAFHLAGELERAVRWYRRGLGPGGTSTLGRGKYEFLEGLVFALDELGRPDRAEEEIDRYEAIHEAERVGRGIEVELFRDFLRWRAGRPPAFDWSRRPDHAPDLFRYLVLELRLAAGADARELLTEVDGEIERASDTLPMLRSLRSVLLRRLDRRPEAVEAVRRAADEIARRVDDEVYGRSFRGLVRDRAAEVQGPAMRLARAAER